MKRVSASDILTVLILTIASSLTAQAISNEEVNPCTQCEELMELNLPDVKIISAENIPEGNPHCRIRGIIGNGIKFEILLPQKWNTRYIMGGGGGFVGSIANAARSSVNEGYATSGTDTGHESKGLQADWALNNMERQLNFGHLAIHRTAEVSKAIIESYYGHSPKYSYFIGCSRGGGQAMMEAQRYPDDFDGIVAGAPAFNWTAFAAEFVQNTKAVYPSNLADPVISGEHLQILQDEILKQCDMIDGIRDSIINNPAKCNFNFDALPKCPDDEAGKYCFTASQIKAIKMIYDGIDIGNGISHPGFPYGGENEPSGWGPWITGPNENAQRSGYPSSQAGFGIETFKYLILQDPDWDYSTYDFTGYEKEIRYASAYLDATSTDYSGFKNRKGKIIIWHGWSDPALSAFATIEHYNAVKEIDPDIEDYMRLYLLPGILHCGGGDGPSQVDWIALIRDWVENKNLPAKIIARKIANGREVMSRPLFPYPAEAVYDGKGDPDSESSFTEKK